MADDDAPDDASEAAALDDVLAAEHAVVWGYGVVGAALPVDEQPAASGAENAHRDVRDRLTALIADGGGDPAPAQGGYQLPFPVLSPVDAAALAVVLEEGASDAWVRLLDRAVRPETRTLAVGALGAAEVRAVGWRSRAGRNPVTDPFPGLPPA